MTPIYADIMYLLAGAGFGSIGTDIYGGEWGEPDGQILCLEGVGVPSDLPELYEQPAVQILVRGSKRETDLDVYTRAKAVSSFLLSQSDCTLANGHSYKGFEEGSNLAPLGKDSNERFIYTANYYSWRNRE